MEEKREIIQKKVYDENGKIKYVIIPNYTKTSNLMTLSELRYYKFLVRVVTEIREKTGQRLEIFPQVATNRIIRQNNRREKELDKDIFGTSIDYVIYNKDKDEIHCCIELDGNEHQTDPSRIKRDKIINEAFKDNIKLIRQNTQESYSIEETIKKILN